MTPIELLAYVVQLKQLSPESESSGRKEPDDDYIDAQCELAEEEEKQNKWATSNRSPL